MPSPARWAPHRADRRLRQCCSVHVPLSEGRGCDDPPSIALLCNGVARATGPRSVPITIFYCVTCNYLSQATHAAEALREALGVEVVLVRGHSGRFEVEVDGHVVLAKGTAGLPTPRDVVEAVARALGRLQSVAH